MGSSFEDLEVWKKSCRLSGGRKRKKEYSRFPKVYKYCTRIGCGAENTDLYFTRG